MSVTLTTPIFETIQLSNIHLILIVKITLYSYLGARFYISPYKQCLGLGSPATLHNFLNNLSGNN